MRLLAKAQRMHPQWPAMMRAVFCRNKQNGTPAAVRLSTSRLLIGAHCSSCLRQLLVTAGAEQSQNRECRISARIADARTASPSDCGLNVDGAMPAVEERLGRCQRRVTKGGLQKDGEFQIQCQNPHCEQHMCQARITKNWILKSQACWIQYTAPVESS